MSRNEQEPQELSSLPPYVRVVRGSLFDVSFSTSPAELVLLQQAGEAVGLRVAQVERLVHRSGAEIPIQTGKVGVRYMTADAKLLAQFNAKVAELKVAASRVPPALG